MSEISVARQMPDVIASFKEAMDRLTVMRLATTQLIHPPPAGVGAI